MRNSSGYLFKVGYTQHNLHVIKSETKNITTMDVIYSFQLLISLQFTGISFSGHTIAFCGGYFCVLGIMGVVVVVSYRLMVDLVGLQLPVPIITKVVSFNSFHREVHTIEHYVIKFVSDMRQICGFLRVHRRGPQI
jgi:hypothetical protein